MPDLDIQMPKWLARQSRLVAWLHDRSLRALQKRTMLRFYFWRFVYNEVWRRHMHDHVDWYRQVSDELQAKNARNN